MRIGIVSYHREPNYGTMLQAYALAQVLRHEGVECEYLDYRYDHRPWWFRLIKTFSIQVGIKKSGEFDFFRQRRFKHIRRLFATFHQQFIPLSKRVYYTHNITDACQDFDKFLVGSDQTWSPLMNKHPKGINFLPFVLDSAKKIAYAPSIGTTHVDTSYLEFLQKQLSTFSALSCRERANCDTLSALLHKKVEYVLDPTLLLSPNDWNQMVSKPILKPQSYVLAYILGEKKEVNQFAKRLAERVNLPVYIIATRPCYLLEPNCLDKIGPKEFIRLVRDAAYVVTDSFHGTLFCINYHVQFYSFAKRASSTLGDNDRILHFLSEVSLEDRFRQDEDQSFCEDIDFQKVETKLESLRSSSMKYLKQIIST